MKTSKYSDSLIMSILKQAESGTPIPNLCREHGMSSATFYKWKAKVEQSCYYVWMWCLMGL